MNLLQSDLFQPSVLLNAIFKTAIDGIIAIDESGTILLANPAIAELFQYKPEELIGQNIKMLMAEPHHTNHDTYLKKYYETGEKKIMGIGREAEGRRKDGAVFPIRLSISEINLKGKRFFTGVVHDLSEQYKAEENIKRLNSELEARVEERTNEINVTLKKLMETNEKLKSEIIERKKVEDLLRETEKEIRTAFEKEKELNELKSRFVTMASHEFRTPLSTILSSTALIEMYISKDQENKKIKHLKRIKSSVDNLNNILNDFLSLSRLEEGRIKFKPEWFSFSSFCAGIIDEMEGLLRPGQKIEHIEEISDDQVFLDKHLLKNILFNLLSNAMKYSPPEAIIYCKNEITDQEVIIDIRDNGIGIPDTDQTHLFTRFFRASNATNIGGTGLGLNIVKRYVEVMNGVISFESQLGEGSSFKIILPKNNHDEKNSNHRG